MWWSVYNLLSMHSNSQREKCLHNPAYGQSDHADKSMQVLEMTQDAARLPLFITLSVSGAFANSAFRIEIWIGLSPFPERRHPLSAPLLRAAVCHVNNKCTQCGDLPRAAGLWCILILLHVSLYYSPSFIWIKEEEFKNGQCGTMGIQIASICWAEWLSSCPLCPSPSQDTVQLPIKPKKESPFASRSLSAGGTQTDHLNGFTHKTKYTLIKTSWTSLNVCLLQQT